MLTLIACCAVTGTQAIPAYPRRVIVSTGSDSFYLILRGDENCKFAITEDGYTALQDSSGWYYACTNPTGEVIKSNYKVCSEYKKSATIKQFLGAQPKYLIPTSSSDNPFVRKSAEMFDEHRSSTPKVGNRRVLIILMQYNDLKFKKSQTDFNRLFNEEGYHDDGAYGSVYDYYNKVSYGQLQLQSDVLGPFTASRNMSYYGGNSGRSSSDSNPKALFNEAIQFAIQEVNLADYDSDGDGYVDNVHIIFAGYGEEAGASASAIWSHEMTFRAERIGGMMIDRYSCSPELRGNSGTGISRIGAPCHEIGHALGAMDYYDVNYQTEGYYEGTGDWDIMASGSWNDDGARPADFNPYVKAYNFGWVEVKTLAQDTVNIISPSTQPNNIYRIDTPVSGDFFLLDNRQSEGINSAEPGKGLLIFHIGPQIAQKAMTNTINSTYPQQCYVVCASAKEARPRANASSYGSISSSGCPFPGSSHKTSFTKSSIPAAYCINGKDAELSLTNITELDNGDISLHYSKVDSGGDYPPDDPPIVDDEIEGDIIWSDDFEVNSHFNVQNWEVEKIKGNGIWSIKSYSATPSAKEPSAISGNRYMSMERLQSGSVMGGSSRFSCRMLSNDIKLPAGEYVLIGKYGGYTTQKLSTDTLIIEIMPSNSNNLMTTKTLRIMKSLDWNSFSLPINCVEDGNIRLAFTGNADEMSLLFIDNLILYKPTLDNVGHIVPDEDSSIILYRLDGIKIGKQEGALSNLRPGIYIVRQGNNIRKLYVK